MKRPLFGIGHSMGGTHLANLSLIHPSLFEGLILVDPVITRFLQNDGPIGAKLSTVRRDRWPSRQIAAESFKKSRFYQAWDPRVLELWNQHGLRDLPTRLYPDVPPSVEPFDSD